MLRRQVTLMYSGVVTTWKAGSPYGFVKDTDTGASYFLHKDDIVDGARNRVSSLPEGFRVEFDKAMFEGRTKAVAVTLRGGAPITSTGERRSDDRDDRRRERRDDRDRDEDRDEHSRRRRDDRDDDDYRPRRRDDDRRDDRRRDDNNAAIYDRELSRIQGSLAALARAETLQARNQTKVLHALVSVCQARGVVVPAIDDEAAKAANAHRWAKFKEDSEEMREAAYQRKADRRAERKAQRDAEEAEEQADEKKTSGKKTIDAEDMF